MNKLFTRSLKSFKISLYTIILIVLLLFSSVTYYSIQSTLNNMITLTNTRIWMIDNMVNSLLTEANQVIYGLSMILSQESININNKNISKIISSFDYKYNEHESIPFYAFKVIDANDMVIVNTAFSNELLTSYKTYTDLDLLERSKKNFSILQIGSIRKTIYLQQEIIPFCISINKANQYTGSICSGLKLDKINQKIDSNLTRKNSSKINLLSRTSLPADQLILNNANHIITINNMIKYYFMDKELNAYISLNHHPELIFEMRINFHLFLKAVLINIVYSIYYLVILLIN